MKTLLCVYSVVAYSTFYCFDFASSCLMVKPVFCCFSFREIISASRNIFVVLFDFGGLLLCVFVCWYFVGACVRVLVLPAMQTLPCCSGKGSRKPRTLLGITKIHKHINVNVIAQLDSDNLREDHP